MNQSFCTTLSVLKSSRHTGYAMVDAGHVSISKTLCNRICHHRRRTSLPENSRGTSMPSIMNPIRAVVNNIYWGGKPIIRFCRFVCFCNIPFGRQISRNGITHFSTGITGEKSGSAKHRRSLPVTRRRSALIHHCSFHKKSSFIYSIEKSSTN